MPRERDREPQADSVPAPAACSAMRRIASSQRIWRDANVAGRHAVAAPTVAAEVYGKALLGIDENITPLI